MVIKSNHTSLIDNLLNGSEHQSAMCIQVFLPCAFPFSSFFLRVPSFSLEDSVLFIIAVIGKLLNVT